MDCFSPFEDMHLVVDFVRRGRIPSRDQINSGLFASHFFNINPDLAPVHDLVDVRFFSSKLRNPIKGRDERLVVLGVTGSADGQNRRVKTDFVIVVDRSGSMRYSLNDIVCPRSHRTHATERTVVTEERRDESKPVRRMKMSMGIETAISILRLLDDNESVGVIVFDEIVDVIQELRKKSEIDCDAVGERLQSIEPRGETNMGIAMRQAISMLQGDANADRNKRIIFITDASPTIGADVESLKQETERAFVESKGMIGVTYVGIG
jgi:NADH dehydrogenase/NADH:ubiquinone oxidoreductase subunit G